MVCSARGSVTHLTEYGLACKSEGGDWRFDASETIVYDQTQAPRERYEETNQQSLSLALSTERSIFPDFGTDFVFGPQVEMKVSFQSLVLGTYFFLGTGRR